jgi:competence protein ComEC
LLSFFIKKEQTQLPCWVPVFLSIGILLSFRFPAVNFYLLVALIAFLFALNFLVAQLDLLLLNKYRAIIHIILFAILSILIGILALEIRMDKSKAPIIPFDNKFVKIIAKIDNITALDNGYKILLSELKSLSTHDIPQKIRLTIRTNLRDAKIGDKVKLSAIISRPMPPYLPDSYDFARDAYFKKIGAVGYSVSDLYVIDNENKNFRDKLNTFRNNIQNRVNQVIGSKEGSIATALMINEYSNIDKSILKNLRATGLAHILSVSGMHLGLVTAIFFLTSRFILNFFSSIALRFDCKKISAFIALIGSFAYLLLSGMEVAAVRSFIMSSMIIIAILINRISTPMRAIAISATIILIVSPENIIHPSFQMSFAAVLALVACFEEMKKLKFDFNNFSYIEKILFYIFSLSCASLVAGFATAPFALYHFNQSSNYSILANLLAVPITSFLLMPCVVLTFLLMPFHLEIIALYPMKLGIKLIILLAQYIAELPYSVTHFVKISDSNLLIIVTGMLWLCIWRSNIRFIGIGLIIIGGLLQSLVVPASIFIDWSKKIIAVVDNKNQLVFLNKSLGSFKKQLLINQLGIDPGSVKIYKKNNYQYSEDLFCDISLCTLKKTGYRLLIDRQTMEMTIKIDSQSDKIKTYFRLDQKMAVKSKHFVDFKNGDKIIDNNGVSLIYLP